MTLFEDHIEHDGGTHSVEVELECDQAVIRFGSSFTLRVDEGNLMKLRLLLHNAGRELAVERRDISDVQAHDLFDTDDSNLDETQFASSAESDMIERGIEAREMTKCATGLAAVWNPSDPTNW